MNFTEDKNLGFGYGKPIPRFVSTTESYVSEKPAIKFQGNGSRFTYFIGEDFVALGKISNSEADEFFKLFNNDNLHFAFSPRSFYLQRKPFTPYDNFKVDGHGWVRCAQDILGIGLFTGALNAMLIEYAGNLQHGRSQNGNLSVIQCKSLKFGPNSLSIEHQASSPIIFTNRRIQGDYMPLSDMHMWRFEDPSVHTEKLQTAFLLWERTAPK